ncbi:unnamed protein product [Thlaspi arvense]|uniref:NADH dehydrogenase [ubiquinone] 1 alpha subcomplex subunit 12 n=1 Tax=Thlaspi arvense TaxID=13288 RepID=A0AAU9T4M5_THLAR|nr:unnamed protein product [Thlaspi arvense]
MTVFSLNIRNRVGSSSQPDITKHWWIRIQHSNPSSRSGERIVLDVLRVWIIQRRNRREKLCRGYGQDLPDSSAARVSSELTRLVTSTFPEWRRLTDSAMKEKRWVVFRREEDPTSIPVEWICWLNGQRKRAPTPEEMAQLEARRERVKLNVALLKKEEEEKKAREGTGRKITSIGKVEGPDLTSFVRHFPADSTGDKQGEASEEADESRAKEHEPEIATPEPPEPKTTEPSGSGSSFRPGTWQPPS